METKMLVESVELTMLDSFSNHLEVEILFENGDVSSDDYVFSVVTAHFYGKQTPVFSGDVTAETYGFDFKNFVLCLDKIIKPEDILQLEFASFADKEGGINLIELHKKSNEAEANS